MEKIKLLSVIVPAYKQEKTIEEDITSLSRILNTLNIPYEILVVIDGTIDRTYDIVKKIQKKDKKIKAIAYKKNHGKGYAIRYGMLESHGDVSGFIDAGMDIDSAAIHELLEIFVENDADIVIGSKLHPDAKVNYPFSRKILSWGYRTVTHLLFGLSVRDTQVGIKFFKRKVVQKVFPLVLVKTFAFDIEVLAVAYSMGFTKIYEGPIKLNFNRASTITSANFWKIVSLMLWDTAAVFYRLKIKHYYSKEK